MDVTEGQLRESYERIWAGGESYLKEEESYYRWVIQQCNPVAGERAFDVGCGGGYLLASGEHQGLHMYGMDFSANALGVAQRMSPHSPLVLAAAEMLPVGDEVFDHVFCLGSLEHFLDPAGALDEMWRVLRPEGRLHLVLPNQWFLSDVLRGWLAGRGLTHDQAIERFWGIADARNLLRERGFFVDSIAGYSPPASTIAASRPLPRLNAAYLAAYRLVRRWLPVNMSYVFLMHASAHPNTQRSGMNWADASIELEIGRGWHRVEIWPPHVRWTSQEAVVFLFVPRGASHLRLVCRSYHPDLATRPLILSVAANNATIGTWLIEKDGWQEPAISLPSRLGDTVVRFTLRVDRTWRPQQDSGSLDSRDLGIAVESLVVR